MDHDYREVRFDLYCETCAHKDVDEVKEPCNTCLESYMNEHTDKPVKWEEKK